MNQRDFDNKREENLKKLIAVSTPAVSKKIKLARKEGQKLRQELETMENKAK